MEPIDDGWRGLRIVAVLAAFLETYRHQDTHCMSNAVHSSCAGPCQEEEDEEDIPVYLGNMCNCETKTTNNLIREYRGTWEECMAGVSWREHQVERVSDVAIIDFCVGRALRLSTSTH
jgi:hypothetical protein